MLLFKLILLQSCSLFTDTIKIEVPKEFVGWCFVVPLNDSSIKPSAIVNGRYQASTSGVVLIPNNDFDVTKDHRIKVYKGNLDVSNDMRYAGSVVQSNTLEGGEYQYSNFYLPPDEQRMIPDDDDYWRENMYKHYNNKKAIFDSLLKAKLIVF